MAKDLANAENLIKYLCYPSEKANEDYVLRYFRNIFPNFTRQKEAHGADGYVPGHFVLEIKSHTKDWFSGLLQGIAYQKNDNFSLVVVVSRELLGFWKLKDIPKSIIDDINKQNSAPNKVGRDLAKKYCSLKNNIYEKAEWKEDNIFSGLFRKDKSFICERIKSFEESLKSFKKVRQKITINNFTKILKQMASFFDPKQPIKAVTAFYSMIYDWDEKSVLGLNNRYPNQAYLKSAQIKFLIPNKRLEFKKFVENYYVSLQAGESLDEFFAHFDKALDTVDKNFRIKHGIFFTDLDLSKFVMWFIKQEIPKLGEEYIVVDPACGSGNLVTNWRSPLKLRHKIVSEIEPELLYAVEQRMKGDAWHEGKYTVVPKIEEGVGLNFLDKSAKEYIDKLQQVLEEKGKKFDKPIAFLCNPPYRGDDDKTADGINYKIHPTILDIVGGEAAAERYCCFLAQMKLICDQAEASGLESDTRLLIFTQTSWLTTRPSFRNIRNKIFSSFKCLGGILVNGREFFDVKGKFPVAFTMWSYNEKKKVAAKKTKSIIKLIDLTWITKHQLSQLPWDNSIELDKNCLSIIHDKKATRVPFGINRNLIKLWIQLKRRDFIRNRRKSEINCIDIGGLPNEDIRTKSKCAYGENKGLIIGFMDDLTPCRINSSMSSTPCFRLNPQFMDCNRNRCFSGMPTHFGYSAVDKSTAEKTFLWYALARTFSQIGYPLWANQFEIWVPEIPEKLRNDVLKLSFAIGFAENECVETKFPANNPVRGAPEIYCTNPMAPTNSESFWSKVMARVFKNNENSLPDQLVRAVNDLYKEWSNRFKQTPEIIANYDRRYFIEQGVLKRTAGIIQIRDYAKENDDKVLLELYQNIKILLEKTKSSFHEMLLDSHGLNYFGTPSKQAQQTFKTNIIPFPKQQTPHKEDKSILEKRLALSGLIVNKLANSKSFGRTKFSKVFYLADMMCGQDLMTEYFREAAGPIDYHVLYDEKHRMEKLAKHDHYFTTKKVKNRFHFTKGINIQDLETKAEQLFHTKIEDLKQLINHFIDLNTVQSEIVATLYASWNDLLIDKKPITDDDIIFDMQNNWHIKKMRFKKAALKQKLAWMKGNNLIPKGEKGHTQFKRPKKTTKH